MALTQEQLNRILGNQSVVQRAFSENRPTVSAQNPSSPSLNAISNFLETIRKPLDVYGLNKKIPVFGGTTLADITGLNQIAPLTQDVSYGQPVMRGGSLQTMQADPRLASLIDFIPTLGLATKATGVGAKAGVEEIARQIETGTGVFGKGNIDPRMYMINTLEGKIPTNYNDIKKLSEMLERAATQKGYNVTVDHSRVSPSTYVTLSKKIDDAPEYQVRLSNHQDQYPSQSPVGLDQTRFSVDPSPTSHGTFEEAVMFLESKGFPTELSTRYKNQKNEIIKQQLASAPTLKKIVPTYKDINVKQSSSGKTFFVKNLLGEEIWIDKDSIPLELRQSQNKTELNEFLRNKLFSQ